MAEARTKAFGGAAWLEKLIRMQHGGVVCLDPLREADVGRVFWAKEKFSTENTAPVPVHGKDEALPRKTDGRLVGYGKPAPQAIADAVEALKRGEVVTFDRPVLTVDMAEVIGFLEPASHPRWLHWEIFAPPKQGLAALRDKAKELGLDLGQPLREPIEDNFLSMPSLLFPRAPDEIKPFFKGREDPELNAVITRPSYDKALAEVFDSGKAFCDKSAAGSAFHYPLTLKFANPFHFKPDDPAARKVAVTFQRNGKALGNSVDREIKPAGESILARAGRAGGSGHGSSGVAVFQAAADPEAGSPPPGGNRRRPQGAAQEGAGGVDEGLL
jgi:hypothetical protein